MTDRSTGPRCGNNPNVQLTPGDRKAVDDAKARLALLADARPYIDRAVWVDGDPLMEVIASTLWKHCGRDSEDMPQLVCDDPRTIAALAAAVARAHAAAVPAPAADQAAEPLCVCGHPMQQHFEDVCLTECGCNDGLEADAADAADLPDRLTAALTARFTERGNPFAEMRRHEQGPDGWPASHPVGPRHVAEVLRELLAAGARATAARPAPADRATVLREAADAIDAETRQAKADEVLEPDKYRPCRDASAQLRRMADETRQPERREVEDPARIDRIRPEFTEHSSVEAIDAQLQRARSQQRRWHLRAEWLISLRQRRVDQKARGEWPAASDAAAQQPKEASAAPQPRHTCHDQKSAPGRDWECQWCSTLPDDIGPATTTAQQDGAQS